MNIYSESTQNVNVYIKPIYLDGKSDWQNRKFTFCFVFCVQNKGTTPIQILKQHSLLRHYHTGRWQEIKEDGINGKCPILMGGQYTEFRTEVQIDGFKGSLEGRFTVEAANGDRFFVNFPKFNVLAASN